MGMERPKCSRETNTGAKSAIRLTYDQMFASGNTLHYHALYTLPEELQFIISNREEEGASIWTKTWTCSWRRTTVPPPVHSNPSIILLKK
jgi:hypothetical protein